VVAAGACNIAGIFLGKGAIEPITDMSAMVLTLTYGMCCWTVLRIRRKGLPVSAPTNGRGPIVPLAVFAERVPDLTSSLLTGALDVALPVEARPRDDAATPVPSAGRNDIVDAGAGSAVGDLASRKGAATWLVWLALIGSAVMAACAFLTPFWQQPGFPLEYQLLTAWGLLGYIVWRYALTRRSGPGSPNSQGSS
jgi:hypothetical protein